MIIPGGLLVVEESVTIISLDNFIISEKSTLREIEPKARTRKIQLRHWAVSKVHLLVLPTTALSSSICM